MLERELKLFIPLTQQAEVTAAVQKIPSNQTLHLAAQYFDTPARELAHQGAALRLRLEGDQWVQTLKMRGGDELSHLEHNHNRPDATLDLSLYQNTTAAALFTALSAPLAVRYQTDVQRTTALITTPHAEIELALDLGIIKTQDSSLAISEVEFELKKGEMAEVFHTALTWLTQFKLLIELRTKSERGDALYERTLQKPSSPSLPNEAHPSLPAAYTQGASLFLSQVIRNAAFIAGIDDLATSKELQARYLMLLRVGIRRLRSCRQLFKPWLSDSEQQLAKTLRAYYKSFGLWRDNDMLWLELQPKLERAGLPEAQKLKPPKNKKQKPSAKALAASPEFQRLLLQSLANLLLNQALIEPKAHTAAAQTQLQQRLEKWLKRIQEQSRKFAELTPSGQHQLRNRIKRLRYNLELLGYATNEPLYRALSKSQDQLGDLCDAYVAHTWYKDHAVNKKQKQFAHNWLEKKITKKQNKSQKALDSLQNQRLRPVFLVAQ